MLRPAPLRHGDAVGLIAPSGAFEREDFDKAITALKEYGYPVVYSSAIFSRHRETAGPDWIRAKDLIDLWKRGDIACIWCLRGGYGSSRLLSHLPPSLVKTHAKIFIGYSDITFLHAFILANCGSVVFHGPNLIDFAKAEEAHRSRLISFLQGKTPFSWPLTESQIIRHGRASGRLVGGNLTCLTHLLGTPHLSPGFWERAILFLEDHGEAGYRIDRMLIHLKDAGIFDRLRGLVLGGFTSCEPYDKLQDRVAEVVKLYDFPVICALPFGHLKNQDLLPLGLEYLIDTFSGHFGCVEEVFEAV